MIKLDYSLETPEERNELVKKILQEFEEQGIQPNERYLEILANYLVFCMEKQEKKEKKIVTNNRLVTINDREVSFEGLVSQLENGEDSIYNLITNDKRIIFKPKVEITKKDLDEIPLLKQLKDTIIQWEAKLKKASGKEAFIIKTAIKEMSKDQYIIKNAYRKPIGIMSRVNSHYYPELPDLTKNFNDKGFPIPEGVSLLSPKVVSFILCNYSKLKQDSWDQLLGDTWHLMEDFDNLTEEALKEYPIYERIVEYKIDGMTNLQIQKALKEEFEETHSVEYISSLWRNKIPKLIASAAEDQWLQGYYLNQKKGKYKRCSKCGQIKLAHNKYFSKNKTSKDSFYSICKKCRNKKG